MTAESRGNVARHAVVAQFELYISQGVIPKSPRFYQRAEGSPVAHSVVTGDPSLRLKNGYTRDDAIDERRCRQKFKMSHYTACRPGGQRYASSAREISLVGRLCDGYFRHIRGADGTGQPLRLTCGLS
jgi:hypothetical protein